MDFEEMFYHLSIIRSCMMALCGLSILYSGIPLIM